MNTYSNEFKSEKQMSKLQNKNEILELFFDSQIDRFLNFLFSIGIVNSSSIKDFINIYHKNKTLFLQSQSKRINLSYNSILNYEKLNIKEMIQNCFFEYISRLDHSSLQTLSFDVTSKFFEDLILKKRNSIKRIVNVKGKENDKIILKYFKKWKENIKKKWKTQDKYENLMTSNEMREVESLKNCTFMPKVNKSNKHLKDFIRNQVSDIYTKLYTDYEKIKYKREIKLDEKNRKEENLLKSTPSVLNSNSSFNYMQNSIRYGSKSFNERQEEYIISKIKSKEKIMKNTEEEYSLSHPFKPNIIKTDNSIEYSLPVYERLYSDHKRRKDNSVYKKNQQDKEFQMNLNYKNSNKKVNIDKLEDLYYDFKRRELKKKELEKSIMKDDGITFEPRIHTSYVKPTSDSSLLMLDFYSRNQLMIENKKKRQNENINVKNIKHHLVKEEEIMNDIEERLYNPGVYKQLTRQNLKENQFSKIRPYTEVLTKDIFKNLQEVSKQTIISNQENKVNS